MTVAAQVKQTVSSLKGAKAALTIYENQEQHPEAAALLRNTLSELEVVIHDMELRIGELEWLEPQYKGK